VCDAQDLRGSDAAERERRPGAGDRRFVDGVDFAAGEPLGQPVHQRARGPCPLRRQRRRWQRFMDAADVAFGLFRRLWKADVLFERCELGRRRPERSHVLQRICGESRRHFAE
jgi:hypothetical protein